MELRPIRLAFEITMEGKKRQISFEHIVNSTRCLDHFQLRVIAVLILKILSTDSDTRFCSRRESFLKYIPT